MHKRMRGQPSKTVGALLRQPSEIQTVAGIEDLPSSSESESKPEVKKKRSRRANPVVLRKSKRLKKN